MVMKSGFWRVIGELYSAGKLLNLFIYRAVTIELSLCLATIHGRRKKFWSVNMALLQLHTLAPHCRPTTHQIQMFFICKTETKLCWNVCGCTKTVWGLAVLHLWEYISRGSFSQCLFAVVVDQFNFIHSLWWLFFLLFIPCIHSNGNVPTQFRLILQIWQCQSLCQSQLQPDSLFSLCYLRDEQVCAMGLHV